MSLPTLAIDPGATGAAVLLDGDGKTVLWAGAWKEVQRKGERAWTVRDHEDAMHSGTVHRLHAVGSWVADAVENGRPLAFYAGRQPRWHLVVEGLFAGKNWRSAMTLAESAALVYGPCSERSVGEIMRPLASVWRPAMLRLPPNANAAIAEVWAVQAASVCMDLGRLQENEHACEAAWMARWGWVQMREQARRAG